MSENKAVRNFLASEEDLQYIINFYVVPKLLFTVLEETSFESPLEVRNGVEGHCLVGISVKPLRQQLIYHFLRFVIFYT